MGCNVTLGCVRLAVNERNGLITEIARNFPPVFGA
jgi:hypothetical protein